MIFLKFNLIKTKTKILNEMTSKYVTDVFKMTLNLIKS